MNRTRRIETLTAMSDHTPEVKIMSETFAVVCWPAAEWFNKTVQVFVGPHGGIIDAVVGSKKIKPFKGRGGMIAAIRSAVSIYTH